jgi:predicted transcriptional regulator
MEKKGVKLFDAELKVMNLLWSEGELTALELIAKLKDGVGWKRTTTYTVIRKCIEKGAIERTEPNFLCRALISQVEAQKYELDELRNKLFGGSRDFLVAALLNDEELTADEVKNLKEYIKTFDNK